MKSAFFACVFAVLAASSNCVQAASCPPYSGKAVQVAARDEAAFNRAISAITSKDLPGLRAASNGRILLVRRFVSGEIGPRGGNLWMPLDMKHVDRNMDIHAGRQTIKDFDDATLWRSLKKGAGIAIPGGICGKAERCDVLPFGERLEELLRDLVACDGSTEHVFLFDDGALVLDMEMTANLPIGVGLFFSKAGGEYRLAAMISIQ